MFLNLMQALPAFAPPLASTVQKKKSISGQGRSVVTSGNATKHQNPAILTVEVVTEGIEQSNTSAN